MGTSFVAYRDYGFWAHDGALEVWLHFLANEIDRLPDPSSWHTQLRDHWRDQAQSGAVGCLWVGLDEFAITEAQRAAIVQLCEAAIQTLESFGEMLPKAELNRISHVDANWTSDIEVRAFTRLGHACIHVLRGQLTTTAATSPVL